jgi:antitoxin VapB
LRKGRTAQTINLQTKHFIPGTILAGQGGWKTFHLYGKISIMALNIKDKETEELVNQIASLTGETTTDAVRQAAKERLARLERERAKSGDRAVDDPRRNAETFRRFLDTEIRSQLSGKWRGKKIPKALREEWLGYGPDGV